MSSKAGSTMPSAKPVKRAAVITHGRQETTEAALGQLRALAGAKGIELLFSDEELDKHGLVCGSVCARGKVSGICSTDKSVGVFIARNGKR